MALLGKISVQLDAVTKGFTAALKRAEKPVKGLTRAIGRSATKLAAFNSALGTKATRALGAFSRGVLRSGVRMAAFTLALGAMIGITISVAGAIGKLVKSFQEIDKVTKSADKLGVLVEVMAALRVAARRSGVDVDGVTTIVQRFTRRLAEASMGTGEAQDALKELGLDARKMMMLSADEQLKAVADAMGQVANRGDQVRLAFKLFDTEGVGFLNTLDLIRDDWEGIVDETKRAGVAFDRIDAAKIELAADALDKVKTLFEGLVNTINIEFAFAIEAAANKVVDWVDKMGGMKAVTLDVAETMIKAFSKVADMVDTLKVAFLDVQIAILKAAQAAQKLQDSSFFLKYQAAQAKRIASAVKTVASKIATLAGGGGGSGKHADKIADVTKKRDELAAKIGTGSDKLLQFINDLRDDFEKRATEKSKDPTSRLTKGEPSKAIEKLAKAAKDTTTSLKEMEKQVAGQFGQVGKTGRLAAAGGFSGGITASTRGGGRNQKRHPPSRFSGARRAPQGANAGIVGSLRGGVFNRMTTTEKQLANGSYFGPKYNTPATMSQQFPGSPSIPSKSTPATRALKRPAPHRRGTGQLPQMTPPAIPTYIDSLIAKITIMARALRDKRAAINNTAVANASSNAVSNAKRGKTGGSKMFISTNASVSDTKTHTLLEQIAIDLRLGAKKASAVAS